MLPYSPIHSTNVNARSICFKSYHSKLSNRFCSFSHEYYKWTDQNNHRKYFDWLGKKLGVNSMDDWYKITSDQITQHGGRRLMQSYYNDSIHEALKILYPEHPWKFWKHFKVSANYWHDVDNQKIFLDWLGEELGFKQLDDWFGITPEQIKEHGGEGLLQQYGNIWDVLRIAYPSHEWVPWKHRVPYGFWNKKKHQKIYFDWLGQQLGYNQMDDWYNIRLEQIYNHGGRTLLSTYYSGCPCSALQSVYPQHEWLPWRFYKVPFGYWKDVKHHKKFLSWLSETLGFKSMEDWYHITQEQIHSHGGNGMISMYNDSLYDMLLSIYPNHEWLPWKFVQTPKGFWGNKANKVQFVEWLKHQLNIKQPEDWYRVSPLQIKGVPSFVSIMKNGGLSKLLCEVYPEIKWDVDKFAIPKSILRSSQRVLVTLIQELFPHADIKENFTHESLRYSATKKLVELDVYLPQLKLAFEYQGGHHFTTVYSKGEQKVIAERDNEKREICLKNGITLIEVPYWWDFSSDSLAATIHKVNPDLQLGAVASSETPMDKIPINSMNARSIQRKFDVIGKRMNIMDHEDWYEVSLEDFYKFGGKGLLYQFNNSLSTALKFVYPEYNWLPWKFQQKLSPGFWQDKNNQRSYYDWLGKELGVNHWEEWLKVSWEQMSRYGGGYVVEVHGNSPLQTLKAVYPEHNWPSKYEFLEEEEFS